MVDMGRYFGVQETDGEGVIEIGVTEYLVRRSCDLCVKNDVCKYKNDMMALDIIIYNPLDYEFLKSEFDERFLRRIVYCRFYKNMVIKKGVITY